MFEFTFLQHFAGSVEMRSKLYDKSLYVQISIHRTSIFKGQCITYEKASCHFSPEIYIIADDIALDFRFFSYDYPALGENLAFENAVNPYIVRRIDLSL